jgi:ribonuclease HI
MSDDRTTVYTDGACLGNPGPGWWAWAVPGGRWRSGADAHTTNQRMEILAALDAARRQEEPLEVVSDSTYVVNCFQKEWWKKWVANGWVNSARQPVANRDLWEPLVEMYRSAPGRLKFRWVKGHSTDPYNDLVDRLAVAAASSGRGSEGDLPPEAGSLGPADAPGAGPSALPALRPSSGSRQPSGPGQSSGPGQPSGPGGPTGLSPGPGPSPLPAPALPAPALGPRALGSGMRLALPSDAYDVVKLWELARARSTTTDDVETVRALVAHDPDALMVTEAGGELIGTLVAGFDGWRATLYRLVVHPDWRRQGVALALVAEAERRLAARGAKRVSAIVGADDHAVAFWVAAGYDPQPENTRYVKMIK